jgi:hypothetical protein
VVEDATVSVLAPRANPRFTEEPIGGGSPRYVEAGDSIIADFELTLRFGDLSTDSNSVLVEVSVRLANRAEDHTKLLQSNVVHLGIR